MNMFIKNQATFVLNTKGGSDAFRELSDAILRFLTLSQEVYYKPCGTGILPVKIVQLNAF